MAEQTWLNFLDKKLIFFNENIIFYPLKHVIKYPQNLKVIAFIIAEKKIAKNYASFGFLKQVPPLRKEEEDFAKKEKRLLNAKERNTDAGK